MSRPVLSDVVLAQHKRCSHEWHEPIERPGCPACALCGVIRSAWSAQTADAGPTPFDRRPWVAERRQQPRRHEEGLVHYAKEALVGAALALVDARKAHPGKAITSDPLDGAMDELYRRAEAYRFAEASLVTGNKRRAVQQPGVDARTAPR